MSEMEFDRSKCFTFFESYYTTGQMIEELKGKEVAYEYYKAIMEYALYKKPIEDKELLLYAGGFTTLKMIDSSQERRSRGFREDKMVSRSILELKRDHPEYSQNKIAEELQISKGKVNKVMTGYREGKYADLVDFNLVINKIEYDPTGKVIWSHGTGTNTDTYNDTDNDSTDRYRDHQRDRLDVTVSGSVRRVADAPNIVASAPDSAAAARLRLPDDLPEEFRNMKFEAKINDKDMLKVMDIVYNEHLEGKNDDWETHEDIRDNIIKEFTTGFYCGNKDKVTAYAEFLMKHYNL